MKLVISCLGETNDCIEYKSKEDFLYDLESYIINPIDMTHQQILFFDNIGITKEHFIDRFGSFNPPMVETLEKWFENRKIN